MLLMSLQTSGAFIEVIPLVHLAWPLVVLIILYYTGRLSDDSGAEKLPLGHLLLIVFLCLYLFSSASREPYFFFQGWRQGSDTGMFSFKPGVVRWMVLTAIMLPVTLFTRKRVSSLLLVLLIVFQVICLYNILASTGGQAFYRDDHPSFLYRLWSYARVAPHAVYYDPNWNGGGLSSYLIGSGTIPLGAVFWPLWRFGDVLQVYTPVISTFFIVLMPWIAAGSVRMMNADRTAVYSSGLLALGLCWPYYEYTFHFGTVGSSFCTIFILPTVASLYRIIWLDRREKWTAFVLVVSSAVLLSWPGSVFPAFLLFAGVLFSFRHFNKGNFVLLLLCAAALVVLLLPLYFQLNMHSRAGEVMRFNVARPEGISFFSSGWARLCQNLRFVNPVILFAGIAGLCLVEERGIRIMLVPILVGGLLLTGWGDEWRPLFQFHRVIIALSLIAVIPAALVCSRVFKSGKLNGLWAGSVIMSLFIFSGYSSVQYCRGAVESDYATVQPYTLEMAEWIKSNTEQDCRVLFAGRTVHGVGAGHVAYLPVLAEREMMATDYYHFSPKLVEYDYPPKKWRKQGADKTFEFMDLYNVGYVVTYHDHWKNWLRNHQDQYEEVRSFMQTTLELTVFRVKRDCSFFLKGDGRVESSPNSINVNGSGDELVLKYNWSDGLDAEKGVELFPYDAGDGVTLIGARPNGVKSFRIRY